jgi:hypothetical protein
MLCGFPEHTVALAGKGAPSQTDLFVLACSRHGMVAITVEGKIDEPFGPYVSNWGQRLMGTSRPRLSFLSTELGLRTSEVQNIRYQLLHRTVSALVEAERFNAEAALMLVPSFDEERSGLSIMLRVCPLRSSSATLPHRIQRDPTEHRSPGCKAE